MKKYKVKVIALSLKNNKIAKFGDVVDQSQVATDVKILVENGYLEKAPKSKKDKKAKKEKSLEPTSKELFDKAYEEGKLTEKQLSTANNDVIEAYAGTLDIELKETTKAKMVEEILKALS